MASGWRTAAFAVVGVGVFIAIALRHEEDDYAKMTTSMMTQDNIFQGSFIEDEDLTRGVCKFNKKPGADQSSCWFCSIGGGCATYGCNTSEQCCNANSDKYERDEVMLLEGKKGNGQPEACLARSCTCGYPKEGDKYYDTSGEIKTYKDLKIDTEAAVWGLDRSMIVKGECVHLGWQWHVKTACVANYQPGSETPYSDPRIHNPMQEQKKEVNSFCRSARCGTNFRLAMHPGKTLPRALKNCSLSPEERGAYVKRGSGDLVTLSEVRSCWERVAFYNTGVGFAERMPIDDNCTFMRRLKKAWTTDIYLDRKLALHDFQRTLNPKNEDGSDKDEAQMRHVHATSNNYCGLTYENCQSDYEQHMQYFYEHGESRDGVTAVLDPRTDTWSLMKASDLPKDSTEVEVTTDVLHHSRN